MDGFGEVGILRIEPGSVGFDFDVEDSGFRGPGAVELPLGEGDAFDQVGFGGVDGVVFVHVIGEDAVESVLVFACEGEVEGCEPVAEGVACAGGFAFGGDGPLGFRAVGAGGCLLGIGARHFRFVSVVMHFGHG